MISISEYRDLARQWLDFVCGGSEDGRRDEQDPIYKRVTENRDDGRPHGYSSCGDLAHAMYEALGVRLAMLNRGSRYRVGRNVANLAGSTYAERPSFLALLENPLECGDVGIVWSDPAPLGKALSSDAHVIVTLDYEPTTGQWWTAEYGQPGARIRSDRVISDLRLRAPDGRKLERVLRLSKVIEAADELGMLLPVDGPAMLRDWGAL